MQMAAGLLIVLLAAAAVAAFLGLRSHSNETVPAGPLSITAFQSMVAEDENLAASSGDTTSCTSLQSICPAPGHPFLNALQRWSDDLNRSKPPARFAVIDAQLRRHVSAAISDLNLVFAAYRAQDQSQFDNAGYELQRQNDWNYAVANSIIYSKQVDAATYIATVQSEKNNLVACSDCQSLVSANQTDCAGIQSVFCEAEVTQARTTVQLFEASLVRYAGPSSLAGQDALLQRDLAQADAGLLAMGNAQLTANQSGFDSGRQLLARALPAINADIAGVLGG